MALPNWLKVLKSPKTWRSKYVVVLYYDGGKYICSHHKTKELAEQAAKKLVNKYKTAKRVHDEYLGWK